MALNTHNTQSCYVPVLHPAVILPALPPHLQGLLRRLLVVMPSPADGVGIEIVLESSHRCIGVYLDSLQSSSPSLVGLLELISELREVCCKLPYYRPAAHKPLMRHMSRYPAWHLLMMIGSVANKTDFHKIAGAALAYSYETCQRFPATLAKNLIRQLHADAPVIDDPATSRQARRILGQASQLFDGVATSQTDNTESTDSFGERVAAHIRAKLYFGRDREHQAIADHRAQSSAQILSSAKKLASEIRAGDQTALLSVVHALSGLPVSLALEIPILTYAENDWVIALDVDSGCLKVSVELFSPGRAQSSSVKSHAAEDGGDIIVIPFPIFVVDEIGRHSFDRCHAANLAELLPLVSTKTNRSLTGSRSGINPTVARLRNGLGAFAIQLGMPRYHAAVLLSDPRLVPTGKFFYSRVTREDLWRSANQLYQALGWGDAIALIPGLAAGSRTVPTATTIQGWYAWCRNEVNASRPGRRYAYAGLIKHHNSYAKLSGSLAVFLLALRHRRILPLTTTALAETATIGIQDKRVGEFPGLWSAPVCSILRKQLDYWHAHVEGLDRRLEKLHLTKNHPARIAITNWKTKESPLLFMLDDGGNIVPLGSQALVDWWPPELGLPGNFSRHFWQNRMREAGIPDSEIDLFVRHSVSGMDAQASTSHLSVSDWARHMAATVDACLSELRIEAVAGLSAGDAR